MQLFYAPDITPPLHTLSEEESKHCVRVLRLGRGDTLHITDGRGNLFCCEITDDNPKRCTVRVTETRAGWEALSYSLTMAVAPTKNADRFEWFLEKATEVGVSEIVPLLCERSERRALKIERAERVVVSAMKQSLKAFCPALRPLTPLADLLAEPFDGRRLIAHCDAPRMEKCHLFDTLRPHENLLVLIGPEGDFSPAEIDAALRAGFEEITLGRQRLRTETAAVVATVMAATRNHTPDQTAEIMLIATLILLTLTGAAIFAAPLRCKAWVALAFVVLFALGGTAAAVGALAGILPPAGLSLPTLLFGEESLRMDALSALLTLPVAAGSAAPALYAQGYVDRYLDRKPAAHISLHYFAFTLLSLSMTAVVTASGGYTFLFWWELMTLSSFVLILFDAERKEVLKAALTYLVMMHLGFFALLIGFVVLQAAEGSADFGALASYFAAHRPLPLLLVFLAGFGMKAGLFPMHVWLPEAHPAAPSHVSALMSGVMIKTGVYGVLRTAMYLPAGETLATAGVILLGAGIVTGLWGVLLAAMQNDIKRLLAYSSIENVGIIFIAIGVALLGRSAGNDTVALCGMAGALLHTLNHSFFKSLLFFGAGNLYAEAHTTALDRFGGVARQMPVTAILFLAGTAAICALPPLNGFVSEFIIYTGMFRSIAEGQQVLLAAAGVTALALIGGLALFAFTKLYGIVFLGAPRTHEVAEMHEADNYRIAAMALPLAGILFIGLFPQTAVSAVTRAAGFFIHHPADAADYLLSPTLAAVSRTAWLLILVVGLLAWLRSRALRTRKVTDGATWGCGFTSPNVRMQYSGESYSEGLQSIATSLTQNSGEGGAVGKGEIFPAAHNFDIRHKDRFDKLFAAWWVELLRVINKRAMRLRTGKINHYVLFALAFLVLIFLLSIFNLI